MVPLSADRKHSHIFLPLPVGESGCKSRPAPAESRCRLVRHDCLLNSCSYDLRAMGSIPILSFRYGMALDVRA